MSHEGKGHDRSIWWISRDLVHGEIVDRRLFIRTGMVFSEEAAIIVFPAVRKITQFPRLALGPHTFFVRFARIRWYRNVGL